ncbi:MAG: c-type cytochrome [Vicinamibacterales bacterium]
MRRSRVWLVVWLVVTAVAGCSAAAFAQAKTEVAANPLAGDALAVKQGQNIFRGRCAVCHGIDAKGYRGSDLTSGDWVHGGGDLQLFKTITTGVPGTEMPGNASLGEDEVWMLIAYLRTLSAPGGPAVERGDAGRGAQLFWSATGANCGRCHMVGARGGRLGPNLSRIGASRSVAALEREVRRPGEVIPLGFETITVTTPDGKRVRGLRKNEDTFSVQVMTPTEQLLSFMKPPAVVEPEPLRSLMPAYGPDRLSDADLADVVRYMRTLRGTP